MTIHKLEIATTCAGTEIYILNGEGLLLIYHEGDCDWIGPQSEMKNLHHALYNEYQVSDVMMDGDKIALPDGTVIARCEGVHVVMED